MHIETLIFDNEQDWLSARVRDVTSTEVAALFGLSKYATLYELWHRKRNQEQLSLTDNDDMKLGRYLQDGIAKFYGEKYGWKVRPMAGVYKRIPDLRLAASYDFEVNCPERGLGILEIKKVRYNIYKTEWLEGEATSDIELQSQTQMLVGNYQWCAIAPLVGGNASELLYRKPDLELQESIKAEVANFWQTVDNNAEPLPVMPDDADYIIKQHKVVNDKLEVDLSTNNQLQELITRYRVAGEAKRDAEQAMKVVKAEILPLIGAAAKVKCGDFKILAGRIEAEIKAHTRRYRNFRVLGKKGEESV